MNHVTKNFDILAIDLNVHNYMIVQQNYFFMYSAKILDLSAKLFFLCIKRKVVIT